MPLVVFPYFNSIKVRLEPYDDLNVPAVRVPNFNSIKVRLEPRMIVQSLFIRLFQFHKGTIRTHSSKGSQIPYTLISIP